MLIFDNANKEKRVMQNILEHTEQKLLATNQELLQSANFERIAQQKCSGIQSSIEMKGVVHRK